MTSKAASIADLAPGDRVILISRVVNAPRDLVFEAFTNPEHLTKFWGPKGFDCTDCKVDLRVGGTFSIVMRGPDGNSYPATGIYQDVTPPEQMIYSGTANEGHPCGGGPPHPCRSDRRRGAGSAAHAAQRAPHLRPLALVRGMALDHY